MRTRHGVDLIRAGVLFDRERGAFTEAIPKSRSPSAEAAEHLLFGMPLHGMQDGSTPFSLVVKKARGATFTDVDGHRYDHRVALRPHRDDLPPEARYAAFNASRATSAK